MRRVLGTLLVVVPAALLGACGKGGAGKDHPAESSPSKKSSEAIEPLAQRPLYQGDLDALRKRGVIRALVTYNRTDFFIENGHIRGIQADFLRAFQKQLNQGVSNPAKQIQIHFLPVPYNQLIPAVAAGRGDIAAHFLTVTPERRTLVDFATGRHMRVEEVLVSHKGIQGIHTLEDLAGREVMVLRGSSYASHLRRLNRQFKAKGLAPIQVVQADPRLLSEDILELVNAGVVDFTFIDDYRGRLWAKVLPNIRLHEDIKLSQDNRVGWVIRKHSPQLKAALERFIKRNGQGTLLGNMLFKRYFGNTHWITDPNSTKDRGRLNRFMALFRKYGDKYGFAPLALAAQAYQESGLHPDRRSQCGAIGLMQLLPSTAAGPNVDIPDIWKPDANVHAAAKYLAYLRDHYFSGNTVAKSARMAFIWAAYNAGPAKVQKMRELARKMGLDPRRWFGNTEVAAARLVGRETVRYVRNIYKYQLAYRLARHIRQETLAARAATP